MTAHEPALLHDLDDPDRLGPPAEVCTGCSDIEAGRLVPVTFCPDALAAYDELRHEADFWEAHYALADALNDDAEPES